MNAGRNLLLALALPAIGAWAQVEVMEPGVDSPAVTVRADSGRARSQSGGTSAGSNAELFNQVQMLQQEVMKLRGLVEEQGEELRQLKRQRLDDYMSIDRRISALGGTAPESAAATPAYGTAADDSAIAATPQTPQVVSAPQRPGVLVPSAGEEELYQSAYGLVRAGNYTGATSAFNAFLDQYPSGAYAGNAHYWLAELYLISGDNGSARSNFETLINDFPDNRKVPDGMFKLGRIYHQQGDKERARELLQRVVNNYGNTDPTAARLASEYMQRNF